MLYSEKYLKYRGSRGMIQVMVTPRPQPVEIQERAMDNLRYIRETLERAGSFTAVPGAGGALMGCTALMASWMSAQHISPTSWLMVWTLEAGVALLIGIVGAAMKWGG